ncbi:hypothetical protein ZOSMA_415G00180 [Zostera marina]|uniref:Uncharacterized protein n=1 Tax=Zostera marina TaxID=29655 RepID=A0A0K9P2Y7_ZOSMR|nr:hypothetical protein ZOSMA_415G00180 [Zostera marina]
MSPPPSLKWGYLRIITGTLAGGALGFYVMHRLENSYKEKMKQRLEMYAKEKMRREQLENDNSTSDYLSDS